MEKLTIIVPSKNQGKYIPDLIVSLKKQQFQNFKVIVVDSNSNDDTVFLFGNYDKVQLINKDLTANDALFYALNLVDTEYVMIATTSDYLYSDNWIKTAINRLDGDENLSLVWTSSVNIDENGNFLNVWCNKFFNYPPPSREKYIPYWLHNFYLPELSYCVKTAVYKNCLRNYEIEYRDHGVRFEFSFLMNFTKNGFYQEYIPGLGHAGRVHSDSLTSIQADWLKKGAIDLKRMQWKYIIDLFLNRKIHYFRNGKLEIIGKLGNIDILLLPFRYFRVLIEESIRSVLYKFL